MMRKTWLATKFEGFDYPRSSVIGPNCTRLLSLCWKNPTHAQSLRDHALAQSSGTIFWTDHWVRMVLRATLKLVHASCFLDLKYPKICSSDTELLNTGYTQDVLIFRNRAFWEGGLLPGHAASSLRRSLKLGPWRHKWLKTLFRHVLILGTWTFFCACS